MKNGWFAVKIENNNPHNIVHYRDNSITRVWIIEDEISFRVDNISDSFKKEGSSGYGGYTITTSEFNKLKVHLEKLIGINEKAK